MSDEPVRRGQQAERIVNDQLFIEAWESVRGRLLQIMETAKTDEASLKAKTCIGLLNDVRQHFARVMSDGKVAADKIQFEAAEKRRGWLNR